MINMTKSAKSRRKTVGPVNRGAVDMDSSRAALQNDIGIKPITKSKTYNNVFNAGTDRVNSKHDIEQA